MGVVNSHFGSRDGVYTNSFGFWWEGFQVGSSSLYVDALRNSWFCYVCIVPIVYRKN